MSRDLVIFGASSFAQIAVEYFGRDPEWNVLAVVVDRGYEDGAAQFDVPLMLADEIIGEVRPESTWFHVAIPYSQMNRLREAKYMELRALGLAPASYVSTNAMVDPTATIGDHVFIFENNVVQPFVTIGTGVVLWSGNHIGHHSSVEDFSFISSHVVVSGHCRIGRRSFLGVNSTVGNDVSVGPDNWILPNTLVLSDTGADEMWKPARSQLASRRPSEVFLGAPKQDLGGM